MSSLRQRLICNQNWNIGFCDLTPEAFISSGKLGRVVWMKNPYKDRWFADPFLLDVTDDSISVFVEERMLIADRGYLAELVIDRKTLEIKEHYVILETDSHLSYPAIIRKDGHIYVYPENALGGPLKMYEFDEANHLLINPTVILNERVADSTILEKDGKFYLIAVKYPESLEKAYLYVSDAIDGPYKQVREAPVQMSRACSRPGGNWFYANNKFYRPAQDCSVNYGGGLKVMQVDSLNPFQENEVFGVQPLNYTYNLGVHTINFLNGLAVIDGYGYLYPMFGRFYYSSLVRKVINLIK